MQAVATDVGRAGRRAWPGYRPDHAGERPARVDDALAALERR